MGQYHFICNLDKHEFLHPHRFGSGLKLMEFGCDKNGPLTGLALLLAVQRPARPRWRGLASLDRWWPGL